MKYYFGNVDPTNVEMFGDEGLFEADDEYFYNMVEFGTNPGGMEDFVIADSVGRMVPISVECLDSLISVLTNIRDSITTIQAGKYEELELASEEVRVFW